MYCPTVLSTFILFCNQFPGLFLQNENFIPIKQQVPTLPSLEGKPLETIIFYLFITYGPFGLMLSLTGWCVEHCCEHGCTYISLRPWFQFWGYMLRSRIIVFCNNSILNSLNNPHTVFSNGCTILRSHQQCTSVPFFLQPCQHLLFSGSFFDSECPNEYKRYLNSSL